MNKFSGRLIRLGRGKLKTMPLLEFRYGYLQKKQTADSLYLRNKSFQERIPDQSIQQADIIIGFDTSSWILAERARAFNKHFILDITIGHPVSKERILQSLSAKYPRWEQFHVTKSDFLIKLEATEIDLADTIVIPGEFVKRTYLENGIPEHKLQINPFGIYTDLFKNKHLRDYDADKLIFLFVGSISARKGIPDLLESWKQVAGPTTELWIVGSGSIPHEDIPMLEGLNVHLLGRKTKKELSLIYNQAHVFVFPSYFEGLAQVQIEAIASGLPVIATFNSGGSDLIEDGKNGYVIEAGDVEQLASAMKMLLNNRQLLKSMSQSSSSRAETLSWDLYGARWKKLIYNRIRT